MKFNSPFRAYLSYFTALLALIFVVAINADAQWQKQTVDTKASLRGLSVVNENVVWASGTGGTFLRTVDGGKNWTIGKVPDADKLDFRDVEAFDANTAYLLSIGEGENSRIYKTTDGGETWKLQFKNSNPKAFFDALAFWDKDNGIAMSDPVDGKYLLLETKDGENWKLLKINTNAERQRRRSGICGERNLFNNAGQKQRFSRFGRQRSASFSLRKSRHELDCLRNADDSKARRAAEFFRLRCLIKSTA